MRREILERQPAISDADLLSGCVVAACVGRALLSDPAFANKVRSGKRPAAFDRKYIQTLS
jgi:2,4-dienoyl-CoA reductase-like NADH-dependent reductase (Old Yellow Enzyme family)